MAAAAARWAGHATAAATSSFAAAAAARGVPLAHFRQHPVRYSGVDAGPSELTLSSIGVGTYLGRQDAATDAAVAEAVVQSVQAGINVVDTAANYRHGRAEVSVGRALERLRAGGVERGQLFVSTKAGYPPEGLLEHLLSTGDISQFDIAGGSHCMHPAYLRASLNRSLASLGLSSVDLLYLHNPAESQLPAVGREAFMQRLRGAFEFCEAARAAGDIRAYGIASWACFREPPGSDGHLSLQAAVDLAEQVGGADHGFRFIQLPINAGMPEAWAQPWQELRGSSSSSGDGGEGGSRWVTAMEAARELGLGVFASGPLLQAQLLRDAGLAQAAAAAPQLQSIQGAAPRLLQLARSTPGLLSALVGHKAPEHVAANLALVRTPPLNATEFQAAVKAMGLLQA